MHDIPYGNYFPLNMSQMFILLNGVSNAFTIVTSDISQEENSVQNCFIAVANYIFATYHCLSYNIRIFLICVNEYYLFHVQVHTFKS